jgi:hypothetical protein
MHRTIGESDGGTRDGEETDSQGESAQPAAELKGGRSFDGTFPGYNRFDSHVWVSLIINIVSDVNGRKSKAFRFLIARSVDERDQNLSLSPLGGEIF